MTVSIWENACLRMLDPRALLIDENARRIEDIAVENPTLVASVREHGVLVPVIAQPAEDGQVRVKDGHSRTLAAILAVEQYPRIPVLVTESGDEQQWQRLRDQWIANEIRAGLSVGDKARLLEQLSLFGLAVEEIASQLSTDVDAVKAGLAVQGSVVASAAIQKHPQLDMLQASALAEFEDDVEASAELQGVLDEEPEQYDHTVALLRHRKATRIAVEAKVDELRATGLTVVEDAYAAGVLPLYRLRRSAKGTVKLTEKNHAGCAGHAVAVSAGYDGQPQVVFVCRDYKARGHVDTSLPAGGGAKTDVEKAEMRRVRANNEAWRAALAERRKFLASLLSRKSLPKQLSLQVLLALLEGGPHLTGALERGRRFACTLLAVNPDKQRHGRPHPLAVKAKRATGNQVQVMLLAVVLGAFESFYDVKHSVNTWRTPSAEDRLYFTSLREWGYTLSKVEQLVLDPGSDADQWPHLADTTGQPAADHGLDEADVMDEVA